MLLCRQILQLYMTFLIFNTYSYIWKYDVIIKINKKNKNNNYIYPLSKFFVFNFLSWQNIKHFCNYKGCSQAMVIASKIIQIRVYFAQNKKQILFIPIIIIRLFIKNATPKKCISTNQKPDSSSERDAIFSWPSNWMSLNTLRFLTKVILKIIKI